MRQTLRPAYRAPFLNTRHGLNMSLPYSEFRNTPLWSALERMLADLQASGEISIATAPEYVIGFMCRELAARQIITDRALAPTPGR